MQTVQRGERAVRKGQEEERGHHHSSGCLQGVQDSGLSLPLPRQTLKAIFKHPKVCATWAEYECCQRYKTITDCIMKSN